MLLIFLKLWYAHISTKRNKKEHISKPAQILLTYKYKHNFTFATTHNGAHVHNIHVQTPTMTKKSTNSGHKHTVNYFVANIKCIPTSITIIYKRTI